MFSEYFNASSTSAKPASGVTGVSSADPAALKSNPSSPTISLPSPNALPPPNSSQSTINETSPSKRDPSPACSTNVNTSALPPRNQNRSLLSPVFPSLQSAQRVSSPTSSTARKKVALEPGHSPLDWAQLKKSGADLKGADPRRVRFTLADVALHNTEAQAWMVLNGKVYNISPYLKYHPGGIKPLLRGAGKDGTKMFMSIHPWVNATYLLDACYLGELES